jgi:hypothetical protein
MLRQQYQTSSVATRVTGDSTRDISFSTYSTVKTEALERSVVPREAAPEKTLALFEPLGYPHSCTSIFILYTS